MSATKARDRAVQAASETTLQPRPFKPRRGLFALVAVLNLLWIGALVTMYFTTVHGKHDTSLEQLQIQRDLQRDLQRELDDLSATTRPGADGSPSAPR
jgi:hypothetical protein